MPGPSEPEKDTHDPDRDQWLERFKSFRPAIRQLTISHLRTLVFLEKWKLPGKVAAALGEDQTSVQSRLNFLDSLFLGLCGEKLIVRPGRRQEVSFTPTGRAIAAAAFSILRELENAYERASRTRGYKLVIGATTYTLTHLAKSFDQIKRDLGAGASVQWEHVRSSRFPDDLRTWKVDIVLAGMTTDEKGQIDLEEDFAYIPLVVDGPAALTNLPEAKLPSTGATIEQLRAVPILVPDSGMVLDLIKGMFGDISQLDQLPIRDLYYGLNLLRSGVAEGAIFVTKGISKWATKKRKDGGAPMWGFAKCELRSVRIEPKVTRSRFRLAAVALKDRLASISPAHPLRRMWTFCESGAFGLREADRE